MKTIFSIINFVMFVQIVRCHLEDINLIEGMQWDEVRFVTRNDCFLDGYPEIRQFLDHESKAYPDLKVEITEKRKVSHLLFFWKGEYIDEMVVHRWSIPGLRSLMKDLGFKRNDDFDKEI